MASDDELRTALSNAMAGLASAVAAIGPDDWQKPSMCEGWTIHDVVDHVIGGDTFAARVLAGDALDDVIPDIIGIDHVGDDATANCAAAAAGARDAFAGSLDRMVDHPVGQIPARRFISFRILDQLGHTWDIAAALGHELALDPTAVDIALSICDLERELLDASTNFAMPPADEIVDGSPQDTFLRSIGRDPAASA